MQVENEVALKLLFRESRARVGIIYAYDLFQVALQLPPRPRWGPNTQRTQSESSTTPALKRPRHARQSPTLSQLLLPGINGCGP